MIHKHSFQVPKTHLSYEFFMAYRHIMIELEANIVSLFKANL